MRQKTSFFFTALLLFLHCLLLSCGGSKSYFRTPNDVMKTPATILMSNGTIRTGLLTILFENNEDFSESAIGFTPSDSTKEEKLNFSDIRSYTCNGNTYVGKSINLFSNGTQRGLFVKRLSPDSSVIQLYQLEQRYKTTPTGEERDYYYISIPSYSSTKLLELQSAMLVPSFESKMAAYVMGCPQLAIKIRNGEKGYTYTFLTATFKKVEIIKRIIGEYDQCSSK